MKKIAAILTMALIFSVCSTNAFGVITSYGHGNHSGNGNQYGKGNHFGKGNHSGCQKFVDEDGDGVCDNHSADCDGSGSHSGCKGFVDADGDGICDNMKYSIKYNLNGGKNNKKNPTCYYNATKNIKLKNPTKKGYTFKGWYTDKQYKKKVTAIKKGSNGKKTLYAKWAKK